MLSYLLHYLVSSMFVDTGGDRACLYFYFLDRSSWAHEDIVLDFIFLFWFDLRSMTFYSDCSLLEHATGVSSLLQLLWWDDQYRYFLVPFSYHCTVSTKSCR